MEGTTDEVLTTLAVGAGVVVVVTATGACPSCKIRSINASVDKSSTAYTLDIPMSIIPITLATIFFMTMVKKIKDQSNEVIDHKDLATLHAV